MSETILDLTAKLVSVPSFTGNFEAIAECFNLCRDFFYGNLGIYTKEIVQNGYRSIIFSNSNNSFPKFDVISLCHMDVVPADDYKLVIGNGGEKIFGRGVFDMKSFIAANLANLRDIKNENGEISYAVVITSDEEIGGENGIGHLVNAVGLEANLILDSDNGGHLSNVVRDNLGAITIKLFGNADSLSKTILRLKAKFHRYHCESYGDEVDIKFDGQAIGQILEKCMAGDTTFKILMFNDYLKYNVDSKYHRLYRKIMEENGVEMNYVTARGTCDSRYFSPQKADLIGHQASGGGGHGDSEWLDLNSLYTFNKIQREFLLLAPKLIFQN